MQMIEDGTFCEDLFKIEIPSLNERLPPIPVAGIHFAELEKHYMAAKLLGMSYMLSLSQKAVAGVANLLPAE